MNPYSLNTSNTFPNGVNAPYGYNDNNFNRQSFPSNMYPINGGNPGNSFDRFNGMSTNTMNNIGSSFKQSIVEPLIERPDYKNKNDILHNNIGDTVIDEHVVEYRVSIDSLDRDISIYPDPFYYTVKFNTNGPSRIKHEVYLNPKDKSKGSFIQETRFQAAPGPTINKEFRNVKYIKLENIVLPLFSQTILDSGVPIFDIDSRLIEDRFTELIIKELDIDRTVATYDNVTRTNTITGKTYTPQRPFAVIMPDKVNRNYFSGVPYYGSLVYKNSLLGNINQLTLDFRNSCGEPIRYNDLYTYDELVCAEESGHPIPTTDIRHPLNKRIQNHVSFIIGVVEGQINYNTKLEK